LFSTEH